MKWEELPLADRALLMAAAVRNGYTDIRSIKAAYANFQNQRQLTGNRYDEGGEFEVVNPLEDVFVDYDIDSPGYTPYFLYGTEHQPDHPLTNQEYYTLMERVAAENNPIWNQYRREKGMPELTLDEEYARILNDNSYDYRGYYNDPSQRDNNGNASNHWPDLYKTVYHPTFSDQSLYSGNIDQDYNPEGKVGGTWFGDNYINYNQHSNGGNLFKTGGNKGKKKGITQQELQRRRDYYRQQLIIRGLRGAQLDAVLANMEVESTLDPGAHNDASGARGLMQWLGSRKPKSWSEKDQLDYIAATYNKFGGNEWLDKNAWKRFNETTDPAEAARLFRRYWERPERSSWNATDALFKGSKGSYLPKEVNDLVAQVSNLQYDEPKAPVFTEEDQRLLDTPALAFYNPEYEDTQAPDYKPSALQESIKLDESLWRDPANNWALYNRFANMQQDSSQNDPLGWMTTMASLSPNTTPEQKEAASTMYQLFAPQDGDYSYHGLNFAAYGGKVNKFNDGGFSDLPEQRAYRRAVNLKAPYTNYEDAIDMDDSIMLRLKKFFDKGVSNCTLTASQLFNPNNPIGRARTIVNDSINNGFYEIDADHVVPGTMVIASHPNMSDYSPELNYHTMIVTGFAPNDYEYTFRDGTKYQIKKGEPLVSYSRGKASADNYVHDIPLSVYNANSEGKTYNRYYRPIDENYPQVMIPEITVAK